MDQKTDQHPSFFQSKTFKGILYGIAVAAILLLTFEAGVFMGYQKALFSSHWEQNYSSNFFPRPGMRQFPDDRGMMNPHGAFGQIIKTDAQSIVVKGRDEAEKTVLIQTDTSIERGFDKIKATDLEVGDMVIVFGAPNDSGQVVAKLIRVLPEGAQQVMPGPMGMNFWTSTQGLTSPST